MKNIKKIFALMMVVCLIISLCACGEDEGNSATEAPTQAATEKATEAPTEAPTEVPSTKVEYKVTVVDEDGAPIANARVQICKDACLPGKTGDDGVAVFNVDEAEGYKISFMMLPQGYEYTSDETEFYFAEGEKEITITLRLIQG
jgi:hypothetical protein